MTAYDKIREAIAESKEKEYTNGMATNKTIAETKYGIVEVIRKPQFFLFILKANKHMGHIEPNTKQISKKLELICKIHDSDVNIVPKSRYNEQNTYDILIPKDML